MKPLDKSQVYSLEGIKYQQAEDLAAVLSAMYNDWRPRSAKIAVIMNSEYLIYTRDMWCHGSGDQTPTMSILNIFEKEDTLEDLIRQRDELNRRIEEWDKPEVGDVCKFYDKESPNNILIGNLEVISHDDGTSFPYRSKQVGHWYQCAEKITHQEVIDLLFKKS